MACVAFRGGGCLDAAMVSEAGAFLVGGGLVHYFPAAGNGGVVDFDIEWDIALSGAHENPPATFQLAAGKFVLVLQILHGQKTPPTELPGSLGGLLEDASLTFTGVGINADCTRIEKFFDVKVAHAVDLAKPALIRKVPLGLKRGLADLCSHLLGRSLSKDGRVRL
ncbi:unnamed protein product [Ascophyllum nodosum]